MEFYKPCSIHASRSAFTSTIWPYTLHPTPCTHILGSKWMRGTWNRCGYSAESLSSTFDPDPFHLISDMMPGAFRTWITPCNVPNICRNLMKWTLTDKSDKSSKSQWSRCLIWTLGLDGLLKGYPRLGGQRQIGIAGMTHCEKRMKGFFDQKTSLKSDWNPWFECIFAF